MTGEPSVSTFSIVARDPESGDLGIAVQSRFFGVGAVVPWAIAGVGAVATQALANVSYGDRGLALLQAGWTAQEVIDYLTGTDPDRDHRQIGVVDARGNAANWTGPSCYDWAGGKTGPGFCVQGNILVGQDTTDAMADAYQTTPGPLPDRLISALEAGQAAGGDSRGQQSAAIVVVRERAGYGGGSDRLLDLHVEDHQTPIAELRRLYELHGVYFGTEDADLVPVDEQLVEHLARQLTRLGYLDSSAENQREHIINALHMFASNENLEERLRRDHYVDSVVLSFLDTRAGQVVE